MSLALACWLVPFELCQTVGVRMEGAWSADEAKANRVSWIGLGSIARRRDELADI